MDWDSASLSNKLFFTFSFVFFTVSPTIFAAVLAESSTVALHLPKLWVTASFPYAPAPPAAPLASASSPPLKLKPATTFNFGNTHTVVWVLRNEHWIKIKHKEKKKKKPYVDMFFLLTGNLFIKLRGISWVGLIRPRSLSQKVTRILWERSQKTLSHKFFIVYF